MSNIYEIPLSPGAQEVTVPLGGVAYRLRTWWRDGNTPAWMLDISTEQGVPLVRGIPLLPGADLLEQHAHLGIPGSLGVIADGAPTYNSLGTSTKLYFVTP